MAEHKKALAISQVLAKVLNKVRPELLYTLEKREGIPNEIWVRGVHSSISFGELDYFRVIYPEFLSHNPRVSHIPVELCPEFLTVIMYACVN